MDVPLITSHHRAVRTLARTPALTIASIVTLALGIGANTALFTVALSFLAGPAFLLVVTRAASYVPARRATRVDPLVALRHP